MQEKYHISRAFTTVVVAHRVCVKSQVFTHTKKGWMNSWWRANWNGKVLQWGGGGDPNQWEGVQEHWDNVSFSKISWQLYCWYSSKSLPFVHNRHSCKKRKARCVFLRTPHGAFDFDIPEYTQLWVFHLLPLHFSKKICSLKFVTGRFFLRHFHCHRSSCRKHCWL